MTCPNCEIWLEKTEWVQQTVTPRELGLHRADVLRQRACVDKAVPLELLEADLAYKAAYTLAEAIFQKHYAQDPEFVNGRSVWHPLDTTRGILTQIDNMVAGLIRKPKND